jgi:thioredoxin 1
MSLPLTSQNFKTEITDYQGTVLVDFWAPWCGPCQMLGPIIDEIATELNGKVKVMKLNVDEEGAISTQYNVQGIPTVIIFKNGLVADQIVGFHQKQDYLTALNK